MTAEQAERASTFPIVGIGASAGGLDAFLEFFRELRVPSGMAFVLVTHLEPHHESQLVEIISAVTHLKSSQAQDGRRVERDHLYILPPNAEMTIQDGILHLTPRAESTQPHYPIDHFLKSLAEDQRTNAIGIVLSGGGSDGADGLRAIKSNYGLTFSQDPDSAQHAGMPHSAVATGAVDLILPPAGIARELLNVKAPQVPAPPAGGEVEAPPPDQPDFSRILAILKSSHSVDFTQYKPSTVGRRIGRRMLIQHSSSLAEYAAFLENHPLEVAALYQDILISVTAFFREPAMFEILRELARESLRSRKSADPYRVWVAGCAAGEEAYSLAITLLEIIEESARSIPIQIFGTDISDTAIDRARHGVFSEKIQEEVSPERLRRFFNRIDSGYRIAENVRQTCIFARHDLTTDAPFSQMDLISCRNVLIYLGSGTQHRILPTLHYGLKPSGILILGSAETVGSRTDLFATLNQEHKIYAKKAVPARLGIDLTTDTARALQEKSGFSVASIPTFLDVEERASRILRDLYAPPGVIVNEELQVLHFHGQTSFYLEPAAGEASLNLLRLARESLVYPLRDLVDRAVRTNAAVHEPGVRVERGGETRDITLRVIPIGEKLRAWLILFEQQPGPERDTGPAAEVPPAAVQEYPAAGDLQLAHAQREAGQLRDYLRKVTEQYEAANEELRAANEEARSSNEELQSTNEELRTAKEELQSSNEELTTVNDELKHRNDELRLATNDLSNVLSAASIPIVMVDMDLRLRRFTSAAERLLGFSASDIGQRITDVRYGFPLPGLTHMLADALELLQSRRERAQDRHNRWYDVFVRPYRTADDRIEGAVIAFIDVDDLTNALEEAETARRLAEGIVETVQHPLIVLDPGLRILRATDAFYKTFQVLPAETEGRLITEIGTGQWNFPELQSLLDAALIRDVPFRDLDVEHQFPNIGRRTMRLNARRITSQNRQPHRLLLAIEDVTDRKEIAEIQYRRLFESARDAIVILDAGSGCVVDVNPYFSELTRYPRAEVLQKQLSDLDLFASCEPARAVVKDVTHSHAARYDSVRVVARDGTSLILEMIANLYRVKDKEFIQLNIRDVTERRRIEDRLRSSNLDLQQFAFAASHDLQEPLRTVTSFSQLIKQRYEAQLDATAKQHLGFIVSAAERMRQMVLDLLGYSHVLRAETNPSLVSAEAVLSSVIINLQMAIRSSDANLTFDHLPTVLMDQTQLMQLLQNLISNAIKYRDADPPRIHLSARPAGREWVFSVADNGVGIDPQYFEHIFAVFKRLHGPEFPGSGIGLAICKRIVERNGGRIWVESQPGQGSTFFFTVPKNPLLE